MASKKGKVGIVGSGLIGKSWAMLFAGAGYDVMLYDVIPGAVTSALQDVHEQMKKLEKGGMLRGSLSADEQHRLIKEAKDLKECVQGSLHVQECVPEVLDMKKKVYAELDEVVEGDTVLSSSSSAMPCSQYTENLKHRAQCIVSHPVNPPYLMPLVELVPAPWTDPAVVARTRTLMQDLGQSPVTLKKEIAGFVQPRIQYAIIQECLRLVKDDVMSVEDVDKVMTDGLGCRYSFMGPFETAHLNAEGFQSYMDRYRDMIFNVSSDSGPAVPLTSQSADMRKVQDQLCDLTPLDQLVEKRKWRDDRLAKLAKIRRDLDQKDNAE